MDTSPDGYGKWRRLGSGIALLVSVQAADFFGQGAVDILARLGVDTLAFGTEEVLDYQKSLTYTQNKVLRWRNLWKICLIPFLSPETQAMWKEFAGLDFSGNTPNHVLALAYAKAVAGHNTKLHPIQRQGRATIL